ncbi:MAG: AIR synthase-related protein [Ginsengibacter sp.]
MSLYNKRGVSAQKEEVHAATKHLDQGLYPKAFCKIYEDFLGKDPGYANVMHADGAGTKSILAYLYWKETGDLSVWKGIAQDAIVMNLDDLLCVGIYDDIVFNSTIDRNKHLIPGEVLETIINGTQGFFEKMKAFGINIHFLGGETADVGDVVRTVAVNGTMSARIHRDKLITNNKIVPGNVIVGLASFGQSIYEEVENSGIGSNGLTSARHDILNSYYFDHYKESFDNSLQPDVAYIGNYKLTDKIENGQSIKDLILSPTRTYAPLIKEVLENHFDQIHGMVHCSGGGQTKCLKYLPDGIGVIKDNLFEPPVIFELIKEASKSNEEEMYQVFNMGCRLEIYTNELAAESIMAIAKKYNIEARIIGRTIASEKPTLQIKTKRGILNF